MCRLSKVHSGQRFYLANAEIEILFTLEDLYPETVRTIGMNGSSTIFTVTVEGQKTMFLGDSATQESTALSEQYGDFLKSDMMQVAHHGYGGGTVKLYSLISPSIVLWPVAEASYVQNAGYNHNKFFLNSKDVKQIFVMGFGQYELKLPYVPDSNAERIPDNKYPHIGMLKPTEDPKPTATSDLSSTASPSPGSETEIPKPYFDLAFKDDGSVYDTQNNVSFTMNGGSVGMNTVQHEDKEYSVKSYRAEILANILTHIWKISEVLTTGKIFCSQDVPLKCLYSSITLRAARLAFLQAVTAGELHCISARRMRS